MVKYSGINAWGDKVKTPEFRVSFPNLAIPKKSDDSAEDDKGKYDITMLFDNKADLKIIKQSVLKAIEAFAAVDKKVQEKLTRARELAAADKSKGLLAHLESLSFGLPWQDGSDKFKQEPDKYPMYENKTSMKASTFKKPMLFDARKNPILDESDVYAGCWCFASVTPKAWEYMGKKGIKLVLNGVQKIRDDEKFGGGADCSGDFESLGEGESIHDLFDEDDNI